MPKPRGQWVFQPSKATGPVSTTVKAEVETKANALIERVLKPRHVKPPEENPQFNYITNITAKWHGSSFYFIAIYACPAPNAISPSFEQRFAKLDLLGHEKFTISFRRHTGKWHPLRENLPIDACLKLIEEGGWFTP